jgi:hypothetical protein
MKTGQFDVTVVTRVTRCMNCPHKGIDGWPGSVMVCNHPDCPKDTRGYIINHPDCDEGFPDRCPLFGKEQDEPKS